MIENCGHQKYKCYAGPGMKLCQAQGITERKRKQDGKEKKLSMLKESETNWLILDKLLGNY